MIIILSMHRSGSSLLTGLLKENGFNIGTDQDLIAGNKDNLKGFMERYDIVEANESMLRQGIYNHMLPNLENNLNTEFNETHLKEISERLNSQNVQVVKDPRFCLTLHKWLPYFKEVTILFLTRNPVDVAKSLERRQSYPFLGGLSLWEFYNYKALKQCQGHKVFHIDFKKLINNPSKTIETTINWLNSDKKKDDHRSNTQETSSTFYDSELHTDVDESTLIEAVSPSQLSLYQYLQNPKNNYEGPYSSTSMLANMTLVKQFAEMGYSPGSGKMLDKRTSDQLDKLKENLANTKDNLTESRKKNRELSKHAKKLSNIINGFLASRGAKILKKTYSVKKLLLKKEQNDVLDKIHNANEQLKRKLETG